RWRARRARRTACRASWWSSSPPRPQQRPFRRSVPEPARDHGLGADAEPAIGVAAEGAAEAERHEEGGGDQDETVDERLPDVQAGEQLGQKDQEARAQHRAEQRGEPTQDDDRDELDREEEAELLRVEEADDEGAEGAGEAGVEGADREGDRL